MHTDQPPRPGRVAQSDHLLTRSRQIPARDGQRPSAQHTKLSAPDSQTAASLASCVNVLFKVVGFSRRAGLQRRARCSHSPDIAIRRLCGRSAAGLTACAVRLTFQGARILNGAASGHSVSALIAGGAQRLSRHHHLALHTVAGKVSSPSSRHHWRQEGMASGLLKSRSAAMDRS